MIISSHINYISKTLVDIFLWDVQKYMIGKYGCDTAEREIAPLVWYINTGRASAQFLGDMVKKKPFVIGRLLHKGGSYDDCISRIKAYIA